jgi:23S rRNA (cytosine1962-C5)-methyltransferase
MTTSDQAIQLVLRKNEDRRITNGHPWVFSNEIREMKGSPKSGDVVEVLSASGHTLGIGLYNPSSLIAVRMLSRFVEPIDESFFRRRIEQAIALRETRFDRSEAVRLIHGEADFLPGLIVDRFGDVLSIQTLSAGMDLRLDLIISVLDQLVRPVAIIERNDSPLRNLENIPLRTGLLKGDSALASFTEGGLKFEADILKGQKTGFFLDQRDNRQFVASWAKGLSVLDCFCNDGGFALHASKAGATEVVAIDSSKDAIQHATANAARNGLEGIEFRNGDVFDNLDSFHKQGKKFDLVILDPPSFTRNKKGVSAARQGYRDLHGRAFRVLKPGGYLATASCSHHIESGTFLTDIHAAARKSHRALQLLSWRGADIDHPTLPGVPETEYLKFGFFRIMKSSETPLASVRVEEGKEEV